LFFCGNFLGPPPYLSCQQGRQVRYDHECASDGHDHDEHDGAEALFVEHLDERGEGLNSGRGVEVPGAVALTPAGNSASSGWMGIERYFNGQNHTSVDDQ